MTQPSAHEAAAGLEKWAQELQQKADRYQQMQSRLNETSVTETSPDGLFRVTVDANGVPTELGLAERTRGMDPEQISARLLATMQRAQATLSHRVGDLVHGMVGDDAAGGNIVNQYRERFPEPVEEEPPTSSGAPNPAIGKLAEEESAPPLPPRPTRPRNSDDDDDGWADSSVLR